ncbi:hypothetical protein BC834DRAFT_968271 [Gloeopeniophorella convolvens]|nr:hypothetical protein BC834DRAFT_968271 [Gloeopeniophorella convolvens]
MSVKDPGFASPILGSEMRHSKELHLPVAAYDAPPTAPHELTPVSTEEMPGAGSTDVQPVLGLAISPKRQLTEISGHVVDYGYSHGTKAPDRPPNPRRHRLATSQSHDRIHRTKTSRLPCPDCPKRCGRKQELKRHVFERHDPGKPLECPFCADYKWKRSDAIKKHILTVHKDHLKMDELEEISALRGFSQTLEYLGKSRTISNF